MEERESLFVTVQKAFSLASEVILFFFTLWYIHYLSTLHKETFVVIYLLEFFPYITKDGLIYIAFFCIKLNYEFQFGVRAPAEAKDFSSSLCVQSGSGAHPASCTMGTGGPFPGGKARPGREADRSPPYSTEVVNE
jgi:hypothetical protein